MAATAGADAMTAWGIGGATGIGGRGGLAMNTPGRAASAENPQNVITGRPSTTCSVSSPGAVRA